MAHGDVTELEPPLAAAAGAKGKVLGMVLAGYRRHGVLAVLALAAAVG